MLAGLSYTLQVYVNLSIGICNFHCLLYVFDSTLVVHTYILKFLAVTIVQHLLSCITGTPMSYFEYGPIVFIVLIMKVH